MCCKITYSSLHSCSSSNTKERATDRWETLQARTGQFSKFIYTHAPTLCIPENCYVSMKKKKSWHLSIKNKAPPPDHTKLVKSRKKSLVFIKSETQPGVRSTSRHIQPGCHQRTCTAGSSPHEWSQSQNLPQSPHARRIQISCPLSLWSSWQHSGEH